MKYYMLEGSFAETLPEQKKLQEAIDAHLKYLSAGFSDGSILLSGPKVGAGGGIIIVKSEDIDRFCKDDPLVKSGIQTYRIIEFTLHNCQETLKNWF